MIFDLENGDDSSSETSVHRRTTRRYIPEDEHLRMSAFPQVFILSLHHEGCSLLPLKTFPVHAVITHPSYSTQNTMSVSKHANQKPNTLPS
jgi:hypothetical protein